MRVIGITGGIGSGKSTLLNILKGKNHVKVIETDKVAHEVMKKGTNTYDKILFFFGTQILDKNGEIDRSKLGEIVFNEHNKLTVLNGIVHPAVKNCIIADINDIKTRRDNDFYFIESALLLEDHYEKFCDEIWYIFSPEDVRRERLRTKRGMTDEKISKIMSSQKTDKEIRDTYLRGIQPRTMEQGIKIFDTSPKWVEIKNVGDEFFTKEFGYKLERVMNRYIERNNAGD